MHTYKLSFLFGAVILFSVPADAQKIKTPSKLLDEAVTRKVAVNTLPKTVYHPVFGYIRPLPYMAQRALSPITAFEAETAPGLYEARVVQVAPIRQVDVDALQSQDFIRFEWLLPAQLTQAFYLWRLGHPQAQPVPDGYYSFLRAQAQKSYQRAISYPLTGVDRLPNLQFLKRLMNVDATPTSYSTLYRLVSVYTKHIELNEYGFPVKTADADYAVMLDNYLMLSNPNAMGLFNNTDGWKNKDHGYTAFVLTPEEHAAADKLLELRREGEKLPQKPTARDLLALAYNRLETHSIPYTQIGQAGSGYKAYPNYKNTQLYRSIKGMLQNQIPLESYHQDYYTLENVDMTHLMVVDAVMGGVDSQDLMDVRRAISAFDKLCAEIDPGNKQAIAHLAVLQQNLRVVFADLLEFNKLQIDWFPGSDSCWRKAEVAGYASSILEENIRNLVGRNWRQR